jgi:hypothetical protein
MKLCQLVGMSLLAVCLSTTFASTEPPQVPAKTISVGQTIRFQLASKKPIVSVFVDRGGVVRAMPAPNDQTTLLITGLAPGKARITVTGEDGKKAALEIR